MSEAVFPGEATVAIIPCTSQKSKTPGPAREVWTGPHFQLILAHAELFYDEVYVMSYKYGMITPDFVIEPYNLDMRTEKTPVRIRWWFKLRKDIAKICESKPLLVGLYTGKFERERIIREFVRNGVLQVITPFEGLGTGQRQQAVYDCDPPFDPEKAKSHEYDRTIEDAENEASTGPKDWSPPDTEMTDEIVWE